MEAHGILIQVWTQQCQRPEAVYYHIEQGRVNNASIKVLRTEVCRLCILNQTERTLHVFLDSVRIGEPIQPQGDYQTPLAFAHRGASFVVQLRDASSRELLEEFTYHLEYA